MAAGVSSALFTFTVILIFVGNSAYGQQSNGGRWSNCTASPQEVECLHEHLVLILRVALSDYIYKRPSLRSQAPWFDPFTHLNIESGPFDDMILTLLSDAEVKESLGPCVRGHSNATNSYVPPEPIQMFRDVINYNAEVKNNNL